MNYKGTLKDKHGNGLYPVTSSDIVEYKNGKSIFDVLKDIILIDTETGNIKLDLTQVINNIFVTDPDTGQMIIKISAANGNIIENKPDGLYAYVDLTQINSDAFVKDPDTGKITINLTEVNNNIFTTDVDSKKTTLKLSADLNNIIENKPDGLYAHVDLSALQGGIFDKDPETGNIIINLTKVDSSIFITDPKTNSITINISNLFSNIFETVDGVTVLKLSKDEGNIIVHKADGLFAKVPEGHGAPGKNFEINAYVEELTQEVVNNIKTYNPVDNSYYVCSIKKDLRTDQEILDADYNIDKKLDLRVIAFDGSNFYDWGQFIGDTGASGPQGPIGPEGAVGPTGEKGEIGPSGPEGLQGPSGIKGDIGETGPQGVTGDIGPEGPQGPKGDIGETGPEGPQGATGPKGIVDLTNETEFEELENKLLNSNIKIRPFIYDSSVSSKIHTITHNLKTFDVKVDVYIKKIVDETNFYYEFILTDIILNTDSTLTINLEYSADIKVIILGYIPKVI